MGSEVTVHHGGEEVAGEALEPFLVCGELLLGSEAAILEGYEHLLDRPKRFSWEEACVLYDRMAVAAAGKISLEECGRSALKLPKFGGMLRALSVVASPKVLYTVGHGFGFKRTFSNLRSEQTELPNGEICIVIEIPEPYRTSVGFFRITRGILQAFPRLLGLPDAEVHFELEDRRGTYLVRLPQSQTLPARIRRAFRALFAGQAALEELNRQQEELNAQYRRLEVAHEEMQRALEVKRRFLSIMSHELRTPLNGIVGSMSGVLDEADSISREDFRVALEDSAANLTRLIEDVLALADGGTEDLVVPIGEVSVEKHLAPVIDRTRRAAQRCNLEFCFDVAPELSHRVRCDADGLLIVAERLIENAVKFTPEGHVHVRLSADGGGMLLTVRDTGIGIPDEYLERIFDLFYQVNDAATRSFGGAGLGLAMVDRVLRRMGGTIEIQSKLGLGTTITVRVPARIVEAPPPPPVSAVGGRRVLVVDDNRVNRMVLSRMLKKLGLEVDEATNGQEAVERAAAADYDAIFMDCEMPVMNGWEATERITSAAQTPVPVIAVTAYVTDADRVRCENAGMCDFLSKPVARPRLEESVRRWLAPAAESSTSVSRAAESPTA